MLLWCGGNWWCFFLCFEVCLFNVKEFAGFVSSCLQTDEDALLLFILD